MHTKYMWPTTAHQDLQAYSLSTASGHMPHWDFRMPYVLWGGGTKLQEPHHATRPMQAGGVGGLLHLSLQKSPS